MSSAAWGRLAAYLGALLLASWTQRIEAPLCRLAGTSSDKLMNWWQYALALLAFNMVGVLFTYALQRRQVWLPLNPIGMGAVLPNSSFNTVISFVVNTNWQGYSDEATMSYLTQMLGPGQ